MAKFDPSKPCQKFILQEIFPIFARQKFFRGYYQPKHQKVTTEASKYEITLRNRLYGVLWRINVCFAGI